MTYHACTINTFKRNNIALENMVGLAIEGVRKTRN
jgi:hypothetical protein